MFDRWGRPCPSILGFRARTRRVGPSSTAAIVARGDVHDAGSAGSRAVGSWGLVSVNRRGFGRGGTLGQVAELNRPCSSSEADAVWAGSPAGRLGCTVVARSARWSFRAATIWDTWDWPLRSYSEAAPKDREGGHPMREHPVTAGCSENLKVASGNLFGETAQRMG
jgi:hypothetical protein